MTGGDGGEGGWKWGQRGREMGAKGGGVVIMYHPIQPLSFN